MKISTVGDIRAETGLDVTILCSSLNAIDWIDGYCNSLNDQFLSRFSVVYVDAGSTDGSVDRFRRFPFRNGISIDVVECNSRISVYEAWNIAVQRSKTAYCMNFNTDDRLYPSALQTMLSYAAIEPDVAVFYSRCFVTRDPHHRQMATIFDWPEFSHQALLKNCICGPFPLLRRNAIIEAGLFDSSYRCSGDYELWLRMSKLGYRFKKVPEVIGSYFINPAGLSTSESLMQLRNGENARAREVHA